MWSAIYIGICMNHSDCLAQADSVHSLVDIETKQQHQAYRCSLIFQNFYTQNMNPDHFLPQSYTSRFYSNYLLGSLGFVNAWFEHPTPFTKLNHLGLILSEAFRRAHLPEKIMMLENSELQTPEFKKQFLLNLFSVYDYENIEQRKIALKQAQASRKRFASKLSEHPDAELTQMLSQSSDLMYSSALASEIIESMNDEEVASFYFMFQNFLKTSHPYWGSFENLLTHKTLKANEKKLYFLLDPVEMGQHIGQELSLAPKQNLDKNWIPKLSLKLDLANSLAEENFFKIAKDINQHYQADHSEDWVLINHQKVSLVVVQLHQMHTKKRRYRIESIHFDGDIAYLSIQTR